MSDPFVISVYTREQAIEDGVLVDVTEQSKSVGFTGKVPVAITIAVQSAINEMDEDSRAIRLQIVLAIAVLAIKELKSKGLDLEDEGPVVLEQYSPATPRYDSLLSNEHGPHEKLWLMFNSHEGFTIMFPSDY